MEAEEVFGKESCATPVPFREFNQSLLFINQPVTASNVQQHELNWEDSLILDYGAELYSSFSIFNQASGNLCSLAGCSNDQNKSLSAEDGLRREILQESKMQDWNPSAMLNNLSFFKQKIHQLHGFVLAIGEHKGQVSVWAEELVTQQQQIITSDLTSIILELISTAGSLLPSGLLATYPSTGQIGQFSGVLFPPTSSAAGLLPLSDGGPVQQNLFDKPFLQKNQLDPTPNCGILEQTCNPMDVHELKDEDDPIEEEHLPPGCYEILQLEKSDILVPRTYYCTICGKRFKRDANLRMHMRGHGDEYKTLAALAKPHRNSNGSDIVILKRYSCPSIGCKRNKEHTSFHPLKTLLCVKNHYKRSHCDKNYTCSRCNAKKFSVLADLKTHEKHCGRDKWFCSCGSFSRKDKLFGHITLFQGHTPAIPLEEKGAACTSSFPVGNGEDEVGSMAFSFGSDGSNVGMIDTDYSRLGLDNCNMEGLQEFLQSAFDNSGASFPYLTCGTKNGLQPSADDS